jgi:hypothetical protein
MVTKSKDVETSATNTSGKGKFSFWGVSGIERSTSGAAINVSANGTSTISTTDLQKVVLKRFREMDQVAEKDAGVPASQEAVQVADD